MESGGSGTLWSSSNSVGLSRICSPRRSRLSVIPLISIRITSTVDSYDSQYTTKILNSDADCITTRLCLWHTTTTHKTLRRYMVKPHGQLVRVSSTPHSAYTPRLSTWWSSRALQGLLHPVRPDLEEGFPLRCFQRLSRPNLATGQCHWRDNPNTRGSSTPVLSY